MVELATGKHPFTFERIERVTLFALQGEIMSMSIGELLTDNDTGFPNSFHVRPRPPTLCLDLREYGHFPGGPGTDQ